MKISLNTLFRLGLLYLLVPLCLFCLGFLKFFIGLPLAAIFIWLAIRFWKSQTSPDTLERPKRDWLVFALLIIVWVLLSGNGGYAFQNTDFNGRNAIFRDLINYSWPVYYTNLGTTPVPAATYSLVYYFGYWLIPALAGKLLGWTAANIVLFLYTLLGVGLVVCLLAKKIKTSLLAAALLLVFFSGMDILGALIKQSSLPGAYPPLWPPITHLEWWQPYQISSFTTQLFWVVNQALPAWLCTLLILSRKDNRTIFLFWSLCFFFCPIPAIGLALLVFAQVLNDLVQPGRIRAEQNWLREFFFRLRGLFSLENILGGGLCSVLLYFFYQSNRSTGKIGLITLNGKVLINLIIFALLEWFILWLIVARKHRQDISWYFMGAFLAVSVLIDLAGTTIISERATIPFMFLLMVWVGEIVFHERSRTSVTLIFLLLVGACTPLYEINRSVYRTVQFEAQPAEKRALAGQCYVTQEERTEFFDPEKDHPGEMVADDWYSLASLDLDHLVSYVGDTSNAFFFKYLAKK